VFQMRARCAPDRFGATLLRVGLNKALGLTMTTECPVTIGNAKVICFTAIDSRHRHTGNTRQIVGGELVGPACGLAVCQYPGEDSFYLFGCDSSWETITDTWHQSLEEAQAQAEFEYAGVSVTWKFKP